MSTIEHDSSRSGAAVTSLLRRAGVRPTRQRQRIAAVLLARPQHLSAEQVWQAIRDGKGPVSRATVYNTLKLFAEKGLVKEVRVDPSRTFFDSNTMTHHHFFNEDTGELTDMQAEGLSIAGVPTLPPGTRQAGVDLVVRIRNQR